MDFAMYLLFCFFKQTNLLQHFNCIVQWILSAVLFIRFIIILLLLHSTNIKKNSSHFSLVNNVVFKCGSSIT